MKRVAGMLPVIGICIGVALLVWPSASNALACHQAQLQLSEYSSDLLQAQWPERQAIVSEALAYNENLAHPGKNPDALPYQQQLQFRNRDEIAWLEIPSIGVLLPVYRGSDEEVLMRGIGHVESSALPVGGPGTRCVLAGHSGMPGNKMLDDLACMQPGDLFTVHCIGIPCCYEVSDIRVVAPDDTESILPIAGEDLCTLVTCSSSDAFGLHFQRLNDLRLLVTGKRVQQARSDTPESIQGAEPFEVDVGDFGLARPVAATILAIAATILAALIAMRVHRGKKHSP